MCLLMVWAYGRWSKDGPRYVFAPPELHLFFFFYLVLRVLSIFGQYSVECIGPSGTGGGYLDFGGKPEEGSSI